MPGHCNNCNILFQLGLTGYPLGHSHSPHLHRAALQAAGYQGEYRLYPIAPLPQGAADLQVLVERLRLPADHPQHLDGLNVTIPHKTAVLSLVDKCSASVEKVGAANTLYACAGQIVAENTDIAGFQALLEQAQAGSTVPLKPTALVLGAGGAARAVVYVLATAGWQVWIAARRIEQARALAACYPACCQALQMETDALQVYLSGSQAPGLLIHTTPLGTWPQVDTCPWPAGLPWPAQAVWIDLVYNPPVTAGMRAARAAGLTAIGGLDMLIEQAARAFQLWTGQAQALPDIRAAMQAVMHSSDRT